MSTRAKFICRSHEISKYQGGQSTKITLTAATAYSSPEDKPFWEATPSGTIEMQIVNERALALFEIGKEFYVDFTPIEKTVI